MRFHYFRRHYSEFLTMICLTALLLFCYTNCEEVRIAPVELKDPQSLNIGTQATAEEP